MAIRTVLGRAGAALTQRLSASFGGILQNKFISSLQTFSGSQSHLQNCVSRSALVALPFRSLSVSAEGASGALETKAENKSISIQNFWQKFPTPRRGKDWSAQLQIRGYDIQEVEYACNYIRHVAGLSGVRVGNIVRLPKRISLYTVIRSPHVHKTSREQVGRNTGLLLT